MERMMDLESPSIAENLGNFWRNLSFKEVSSFSQLYSCGICLELRAWKRQEMCDTNIGKMRKFLRQRVRKKSSLEYACYGCERAGGCAIDKSMCRDASQVPQPTCYWHSGQLGNLTIEMVSLLKRSESGSCSCWRGWVSRGQESLKIYFERFAANLFLSNRCTRQASRTLLKKIFPLFCVTYRVFFNTGPPPKISKFRKVNLG